VVLKIVSINPNQWLLPNNSTLVVITSVIAHTTILLQEKVLVEIAQATVDNHLRIILGIRLILIIPQDYKVNPSLNSQSNRSNNNVKNLQYNKCKLQISKKLDSNSCYVSYISRDSKSRTNANS
jgi:hypothetical protein